MRREVTCTFELMPMPLQSIFLPAPSASVLLTGDGFDSMSVLA